jgi:hypothetical protein
MFFAKKKKKNSSPRVPIFLPHFLTIDKQADIMRKNTRSLSRAHHSSPRFCFPSGTATRRLFPSLGGRQRALLLFPAAVAGNLLLLPAAAALPAL